MRVVSLHIHWSGTEGVCSYLFLPGFMDTYWHVTMPVGTVTDSWGGGRRPPSHLAAGLPTAPSVEP